MKQAEQEKLAKLELQITAIEAKAEICQANIKALTSPKELLQAQEGLKGMAAELQTLQMQLSKVTHSLLGLTVFALWRVLRSWTSHTFDMHPLCWLQSAPPASLVCLSVLPDVRLNNEHVLCIVFL